MTNTQLKEVIFSLAKDIPTSQRADFLGKIKTSFPNSSSIKVQKIVPIDKILQAIEALKENIEERIEAIEDGTYWERIADDSQAQRCTCVTQIGFYLST